MTREPFIAHSELTNEIYIVVGKEKYRVTEQAIKAVVAIKALEQEPRCKDCKWWKDSDGKYRRGCRAESPCPINTHTVCCGEGYCYMFEPQESED